MILHVLIIKIHTKEIIMKKYNSSKALLVQLYEALLSAGNFKDEEELIVFLTKFHNEILIAFDEFQKDFDLRS